MEYIYEVVTSHHISKSYYLLDFEKHYSQIYMTRGSYPKYEKKEGYYNKFAIDNRTGKLYLAYCKESTLDKKFIKYDLYEIVTKPKQ